MKALAILFLCGVAALARAETSTNELGLTISPGIRYVTVSGDERKFREDWQIKDNWAGGVEDAAFQHSLGNGWQLNMDGRAIFDEEDYRIQLEIVKPEVGFVRGGFTEFRTYDDDTGGFYRGFTPSSFGLDRDLKLSHGDFFVELGLTLPDAPKIIVGYERQFRNGQKALLEWGSVTQGLTTRKVYPSYKDIDETVDIIRLQIEHTIKNVHLGDQFRYERYDTDTTRFDATPAKTVAIRENYRHDAFYNTFVMDSHCTEKMYWSLGYLFATVDGNGGLALATVPFNAPFDKNWFTRAVSSEVDSHVVNLNLSYGPFSNFFIYAGVQAEKTKSDGFTDAILTELAGGGVTNSPAALIHTRNDKDSLEETFGVRYTGLPYTTLYAEGRWAEQWIDLTERETEDAVLNLQRETDTQVFRQDYRAGFNCSPFKRITWSGRYRHAIYDNDYDHEADNTAGYPAFIDTQRFITDEFMTKLTYRACREFTVSLQYQLASTDTDTGTEAISGLGIPAGKIRSANYDSNIYSISATLTPISRMYITALVSYQDTRTKAFDNSADSVVTYKGNVVSVLGTVGYALDKKSDATVEYSYTHACNAQANAASGLPLGVDNQRHAILAGLSRKLTDNMIARLRYGFYYLDDNSDGGVNNYKAHLFSATCTLKF